MSESIFFCGEVEKSDFMSLRKNFGLTRNTPRIGWANTHNTNTLCFPNPTKTRTAWHVGPSVRHCHVERSILNASRVICIAYKTTIYTEIYIKCLSHVSTVTAVAFPKPLAPAFRLVFEKWRKAGFFPPRVVKSQTIWLVTIFTECRNGLCDLFSFTWSLGAARHQSAESKNNRTLVFLHHLLTARLIIIFDFGKGFI